MISSVIILVLYLFVYNCVYNCYLCAQVCTIHAIVTVAESLWYLLQTLQENQPKLQTPNSTSVVCSINRSFAKLGGVNRFISGERLCFWIYQNHFVCLH